jgi:hypothetical protein
MPARTWRERPVPHAHLRPPFRAPSVCKKCRNTTNWAAFGKETARLSVNTFHTNILISNGQSGQFTEQRTTNLLRNIKVGSLLARGFAVVLAFSILTTVVGFMQLDAIAEEAEAMLALPIQKERDAADWNRNIAVAPFVLRQSQKAATPR